MKPPINPPPLDGDDLTREAIATARRMERGAFIGRKTELAAVRHLANLAEESLK